MENHVSLLSLIIGSTMTMTEMSDQEPVFKLWYAYH